jgi:hypothetical protein
MENIAIGVTISGYATQNEMAGSKSPDTNTTTRKIILGRGDIQINNGNPVYRLRGAAVSLREGKKALFICQNRSSYAYEYFFLKRKKPCRERFVTQFQYWVKQFRFFFGHNFTNFRPKKETAKKKKGGKGIPINITIEAQTLLKNITCGEEGL